MDQIQKFGNSPSMASSKPVFILGIRHRSGTNLLLDVLVRHPECAAHSDPEDFLVSRLVDIRKYVETLQKRRRSKQFRTDNRQELTKIIGEGLIGYITKNVKPDATVQDTAPHRVITKTPTVEGLQYFREVFPDAYLILLIRDGRSVVESAVKSFGANFDRSCQRYAAAANNIASFMVTDPNPEKTILIRFEDYIRNKQETVETLLRFLELSTDSFPFEDLELMPVRGSSELKEKNGDAIHWEPVATKTTFDPTLRHSGWSEFKHSRFEWLAGKAQGKMGYGRSGKNSPLFYIRNVMADICVRLDYSAIRGKLRSLVHKAD